ncbi:hypothetical protein ES703_93765 [subsurface metagenome]
MDKCLPVVSCSIVPFSVKCKIREPRGLKPILQNRFRYMWIIIGIYLLVGLIRVGYDFIQPYHNQPEYIAAKRWMAIFLFILFWPYLVIVSGDIHYLIMKIKNKFKNTNKN